MNSYGGVYIHPLSELSDDGFLTALGKTANIVISYDTSYSSELFMFGGGDSDEGHLISHGQPIRRFVDDGHIPGKNQGLSWISKIILEWSNEKNVAGIRTL